MVRKALITTVYKTFISPKMFMIPLNWESSHMIYYLITHISSLQCRNARIEGENSGVIDEKNSGVIMSPRTKSGTTYWYCTHVFFIQAVSRRWLGQSSWNFPQRTITGCSCAVRSFSSNMSTVAMETCKKRQILSESVLSGPLNVRHETCLILMISICSFATRI